MQTVRATMAQALVRFLARQHVHDEPACNAEVFDFEQAPGAGALRFLAGRRARHRVLLAPPGVGARSHSGP